MLDIVLDLGGLVFVLKTKGLILNDLLLGLFFRSLGGTLLWRHPSERSTDKEEGAGARGRGGRERTTHRGRVNE